MKRNLMLAALIVLVAVFVPSVVTEANGYTAPGSREVCERTFYVNSNGNFGESSDGTGTPDNNLGAERGHWLPSVTNPTEMICYYEDVTPAPTPVPTQIPVPEPKGVTIQPTLSPASEPKGVTIQPTPTPALQSKGTSTSTKSYTPPPQQPTATPVPQQDCSGVTHYQWQQVLDGEIDQQTWSQYRLGGCFVPAAEQD